MKPRIPKPDDAKTDADYDVGYGRPPKHTRFQKGQSGNPQGRARGKPNVGTLLEETVRASVMVVDGGRRVRRSKLQVAFTQVVNKAAGGDAKAFGQLHRLLALLPAKEVEGPLTPDMAADRDLARKIAQRLALKLNNSDPEGGDDPD